jgi:2-oxoglutarate dehydrogenase E2 component (dihydrolipoamide succinyltransferase)
MSAEIKAPVFPESVEEGTIMTWHKRAGDPVRTDEKLADIETDKVVLEVAAREAGKIEKLIKQEGETVISGEVIALMGDGAAIDSPAAAPAPENTSIAAALPPSSETAARSDPELGISPSARKLIQEHELDTGQISGSGRQGRITKADVLEVLQQSKEATAPAAPAPDQEPAAASPAPDPAPRPSIEETSDERLPMSRIRARIAQRLVEAQQEAAILTTFNELNMKPVIDLRNRYKDEFEKKHGVKLGFMSFFVKAAAVALRRYPVVNASVEGTDIVYHGDCNIGIAVSSERGLIVPVLRNADQLAFHDVEQQIRDFGARAQANQIRIEELQGGTFTISNGGVFGSMLSTPILNPPQSGILGMHNITERPVAEEGEVVIRPMMYLALSYDHRIIDGREAV